jgi:hypothetical protein
MRLEDKFIPRKSTKKYVQISLLRKMEMGKKKVFSLTQGV